MKRLLLLVVCLLLQASGAWGQALLSGTVRDSLTQRPLPFASVFLANTTLGATTNEQGQFQLKNVPAGSYDLVASYVGYHLAKVAVTVSGSAPQQFALHLAPQTSRLAEVVVRGQRHVNRPEDYRRFLELFLGRTTFSQQCRIRNPQAVVIDYDPNTKELTATATDYVEVENQALGYRLKYYGLRFSTNYGQQMVIFYGQPVFEAMVPRNRHQRWRWESNRLAAYQGSLTHFLRSVYENQVAEEGFLAQMVRIEPNLAYVRADSLRRQLGQRHPARLSNAERDSLARWSRVLPSLQYLYTASRPIDSLRRVAADGRVFLRFPYWLQVSYKREPPDPQYPAPAVLPGQVMPPQVSRLCLLEPEAELQPNGHLKNPLAVFNEEYWAFEKIGELLPLDYRPPSLGRP